MEDPEKSEPWDSPESSENDIRLLNRTGSRSRPVLLEYSGVSGTNGEGISELTSILPRK